MSKYIIVFGGVISGVGKGVTTASLGKIFKEYGFNTTLVKIDPYLNFDAGTLRPTEHGEVWVTEDGGEIDQDLGTYERFLNEDIPKKNNITSGQVYKTIIENERAGHYLGKTVQFIPHIPDEIVRRIKQAGNGYDVTIVEIGGTVGDYENIPFLFAAKGLQEELGNQEVAYMLVSYLPVPCHMPEMKTKPTQQAIRLLRQEGIVPDIIVCRTAHAIDDERKEKIERYAHMPSDHIIAAPDVPTIYQVPLELQEQGLGEKLLKRLQLTPKKEPQWQNWQQQVHVLKEKKEKITIGLVGKYIDSGMYQLHDSYVSIEQACLHAAVTQGKSVDIVWLDAQSFEHTAAANPALASLDGIIVPGGFGASGIDGKIAAITYARTHNIPFLGLCYGMQLAVVEYARNVAGMHDAHTTEVAQDTPYPVIDLLPMQKALLANSNLGGTMRLGAYSAHLKTGTRVAGWYAASDRVMHDPKSKALVVYERHRHRYEVNPAYVGQLEQAGLVFSGYHERADGTRLMEYIELPEHPFFVATQAHPEFKSRFGNPNPLFVQFAHACVAYRQEASNVQRADGMVKPMRCSADQLGF